MITVLSYGWYKSKGVDMKIFTPFDLLEQGVLQTEKRGFACSKKGFCTEKNGVVKIQTSVFQFFYLYQKCLQFSFIIITFVH